MAINAAMLLKMALKAGAKKFGEKLGSELFKDIYGDVFGSDSGLTASEMRKIFSEVLEVFSDELKLHIDQSFANQRIKDAQLALFNLAASVEKFSVAPAGQIDMLDEAARDGMNVSNAFFELGAPAIEHYVFAVTLYISVYEARAKYINADNKTVILQIILPQALSHYKAMRSNILEMANQRVQVTNRTVWAPPRGETIIKDYSVLIDGQRIAGSRVVYTPTGEVRGEDRFERMQERVLEERARIKEETERRLQATDNMVKAWQEKYSVDAARIQFFSEPPSFQV